MLSLEKELGPDLVASAAATFRRYDNFDWAKLFYPADIYPSTPDLVIDNTATWFAVAGTIPDTVTIGEETVDLGDAARPALVPAHRDVPRRHALPDGRQEHRPTGPTSASTWP